MITVNDKERVSDKKRIIIVGGGISGLTTAYFISKAISEHSLPATVTLIESKGHLGGVIVTRDFDGFRVEEGPDSFTTFPSAAFDLCQELGLEKQLIGVSPNHRQLYLCEKDRLKPFPKDFYLMTPTSLRALIDLPAVSLFGKVRMAWEYFVSGSQSYQDESVGHFIERRFGDEALKCIAQPLLGSIFGGDLKELSLQALLPNFFSMEKKHGGIIRALRLGAKKNVSAKASKLGFFATPEGGMEELVASLVKHSENVQYRLSTQIERLELSQNWKVVLDDEEVFDADIVCLATSAAQAAALTREASPDLGEALSKLSTKSMAVVHLAFQQDQFRKLSQGSGFVGSLGAGIQMLGSTFSNQKFMGRAPDGSVLLRVILGQKAPEELANHDDAALIRYVLSHLNRILEIDGNPSWSYLNRCRMPLYKVGHPARIQNIQNALKKISGLFLTGNSYEGASVPACIAQGKKVALQMIKLCKQETASMNFAEQAGH